MRILIIAVMLCCICSALIGFGVGLAVGFAYQVQPTSSICTCSLTYNQGQAARACAWETNPIAVYPSSDCAGIPRP